MSQANESPEGVGAPNRAKEMTQANDPQDGTAATFWLATIQRRLSGEDDFDPNQIALDHAALVAPIALRERERAAAERQQIRASHRAVDPLSRLLIAIQQIAAQGGVCWPVSVR